MTKLWFCLDEDCRDKLLELASPDWNPPKDKEDGKPLEKPDEINKPPKRGK